MSANITSPTIDPVPTAFPHVGMSFSSSENEDAMKAMAIPPLSHMMSADDPDNPQNWPILKKTYASAVAFAFAWIV